MTKIVLSYRREDSQAATHMLYERLRLHFGRKSVFLDFDSISPGEDFREHIEGVLLNSDYVLAIIGLRWRGVRAGKGRLHDAGDWVRIEIETAFANKLKVVPVLVDNTVMPKPEQMPESIRKLAYLHAIRVETGAEFEIHANRLIKALEGRSAADEAAEDEPEIVVPEPPREPPMHEVPVPMAGADITVGLDVSLEEAMSGRTRTVRLGDGRMVSVTIPAGVRDGEVLVADREGEAGRNGGPAGNLLLLVRLLDDARIRRIGSDLAMDFPVAETLAAAGGMKEHYALGRVLSVRIPPNLADGQTLRLKGEGLPARGAIPAGDIALRAVILRESKPAPQQQQRPFVAPPPRVPGKDGRTLNMRPLIIAGLIVLALVVVSIFIGVTNEQQQAAQQQSSDPATDDAAINSVGVDAEKRSDYSEAMTQYKKAADHDHGNADAMVNIGNLYLQGSGVEKSETDALGWYQRAEAAGTTRGKASVAISYYWGYGLKQDVAEARRRFKEIAATEVAAGSFDLGVLVAQYYLGQISEHGYGGAKIDYGQARNWYDKMIAQADAAQRDDDDSFEQHPPLAVGFVRSAQYELGRLYFEGGNGLPQDMSAARPLLRAAADGGVADAQNYMGVILDDGLNDDDNPGEAAKWYQRAADAGNKYGEYNIATMLRNGHGVARDLAAAVQYYQKAADQDHDYAQYELALCYASGTGATQNLSLARTYMLKAASNNVAAAKTWLANNPE